MALDNDDETQANVSDMERIYYIPFKNVHILKSNEDDETQDIKPDIVDETCSNSGESPSDSGVQLKSHSGTISVAYQPIDDVSISTGIPVTMIVGKSSTEQLASITFSSDYIGKTFFLYSESDSYIFEGTFSEDFDSTSNIKVLDKVKSGSFDDSSSFSTQKIGE